MAYTVNKEKADKYSQLVNDVAAKYEDPKIITRGKQAGFKWFSQCREINLWTYWQGWGYREKTPDIDIMLVGQDWDNPFAANSKEVVSNIAAMNEGRDVKYLENIKITSQTDANLSILFKELGYDDIIHKRYDSIFFTNFYLGYKTDKKVSSAIMKEDAPEFKRLCNIIEPQIVICLGRLAYESAVFSLTGKKPPIKDFNSFLDSGENYQDIELERKKIRVYAVGHPGGLGIKNRQGLQKQIGDWKEIHKNSAALL